MALHEEDKDSAAELLVDGRYQRIPRDPAKHFKRATLAAGAVLYRRRADAAEDATGADAWETAVVHRPHYDDWSLPKGKVDPGEAMPTTAHREILEETGLETRLEKLVGTVTYPVGDRTKVVYYWTASVVSGEFTANNEVDELRWLPFDEAAELLSYAVDRRVLEKALKRITAGVDTRVLYVRHARAHQRRNWAGDDFKRPLDKKGRRQSEMLIPALLPFHPTAVYSAEPDRCRQTAAPLADELGVDVTVDRAFGDEGWLENMTGAQKAFTDVVARGGVPVIVGQGLIIPDMIAWLSANGTLPLDSDAESKKASCWVLSFADGRLVGADYLASPLPAK
ncbi:NUDIX hydrolase [Corynebacterium frankenforstense]